MAVVQVSSHYVFQHGTLSTRLTPDHHYLGKIDRILNTDGRENILKLVDQPTESVSMAAQRGGHSGDADVISDGSEIPPCADADMMVEGVSVRCVARGGVYEVVECCRSKCERIYVQVLRMCL